MMKRVNLFWIRTVELIVTIILAIFVFFGNLDEEIGLILNDNIAWIPLTLLVILFLLVLIEFFKETPFIRATYLLIAIITCALMFSYGIEAVNASCWFMGLVYAPFLAVKYIKTKYPGKVSNIKDNKNTTLPVAIYSKKQYLINNAVSYVLIGTLAILGLFAILIWKWEVWAIFSLIGGGFVLWIIVLGVISFRNNPFRKMLLRMSTNASYEGFEKDLNELLKENLHPETINNLYVVKYNFLNLKNRSEATELFTKVTIPTNKLFVLQYEMVEPFKYFYEGNFEKASELINTFEKKYPKNKSLELLKERIRLQDVNVINDNFENILSIHTPFKFSNVCNADVLLEYYSKRGNIDKAKYYAEYILSLNTDLDEFNNDAKAVINEK